jgi:hypothetical protein
MRRPTAADKLPRRGCLHLLGSLLAVGQWGDGIIQQLAAVGRRPLLLHSSASTGAWQRKRLHLHSRASIGAFAWQRLHWRRLH